MCLILFLSFQSVFQILLKLNLFWKATLNPSQSVVLQTHKHLGTFGVFYLVVSKESIFIIEYKQANWQPIGLYNNYNNNLVFLKRFVKTHINKNWLSENSTLS